MKDVQMKIQLSILIPHYNSPHSLKALLQTIGYHNDVEVIVIDDNSTKFLEDYYSCVDEFKEKVKFLTNNTGENNAGSARNVGLDAATGKWLLFADADDYYVDGWYDIVKQYFEDKENDIIHFVVSEEDKRNQQTDIKKAVLRYNLLCQAWLKGCEHADTMIRIYYYAPWSKMIRRDLVKKNDIRFDSIRYSNDLLFSTKVGVLAGKVTVCEHPIYFHTTTEGSLSTIATEEAFYTKQISYCKRNDFLHENLDIEEWRHVNNNEGLRRLGIAVKRGYGIKNVIKYYRLYKAHHVPVFTLKPDEITRLKRLLRWQ